MTIELRWTAGIRAGELTGRRDLSGRAGVYLWIVQGNPRRIAYVGETSDFLNRMLEHCQALIGGRYWLGDPDTKRDYVELLREWFYEKGQPRSFDSVLGDSRLYVPQDPRDLNFHRAFLDPKVSEMRRSFLDSIHFAFAEIDDKDRSLRRDLEGLLLERLRRHYSRMIGTDHSSFRFPGSKGADTLLGRITRYCQDTSYSIAHEGDKAEIPCEVRSVTDSKRLE